MTQYVLLRANGEPDSIIARRMWIAVRTVRDYRDKVKLRTGLVTAGELREWVNASDSSHA